MPVTCEFCNKQLKGAYSLKLHMKSQHTPEEEFLHGCTLCGKRYARRDYLKEHVNRVHLKQSKHFCGHCGRGFDRPGKRDTHQNKCTGSMEHVTMTHNSMDTDEMLASSVTDTAETEQRAVSVDRLTDGDGDGDANESEQLIESVNTIIDAANTPEIEQSVVSVDVLIEEATDENCGKVKSEA